MDRDEQLAQLYAQVPALDCKMLCGANCGPIDPGPRERERLAEAGSPYPAFDEIKTMRHCPKLVDGLCSVHEVRPMICRVWGNVSVTACEYGCRPKVPLLIERAAKLIEESQQI